MYELEFKLGEVVWDDLTCKQSTIVGVEYKVGKCSNVQYHGVVVGYWLDNEWVGGGRHPWEMTKLDERETNP